MSKKNYWLIANAIGITAFLFFASKLWPNLVQQNVPLEMRLDAALPFFTNCLPILLLFFLINMIWLIQIFVTIIREHSHSIISWLSLVIWLLVVASWIIAFKYDRSRSWKESSQIEEMRRRGEW